MSAQSNCAAKASLRSLSCLVAALLVATGPVRASDVDTEHLFGFTEGADIGRKGEREAESETIGRFGKAAGSYAAMTQNDEVKWLPTGNLRIGANVVLAYFDISGVPGLPDAQLATFEGLSFEARFMLMDRHYGPLGLTVIAEPRWGRVDATSGDLSTSYGGALTVAADREMIDNILFGALNVLYDHQATRLPIPDTWAHESKFGFSAALSSRVNSALFVGGEVRYFTINDGLGLGSSSGQAVFAGPTFYLQIAKGMALSGAWNMQVAGHVANGGSLDLTHFERQQAKVRFNANF
jgi:hypothetical protein